jgi:hypothetical protein
MNGMNEPNGGPKGPNGWDCPRCGARPGELHGELHFPDDAEGVPCDWEQCPYCGHVMSGACCGREIPQDDRMPWTGELPGVAECQEFGWFVKWVPGRGWVRYDPDDPHDPDAVPDLYRLLTECVWDRKRKRWRRP